MLQYIQNIKKERKLQKMTKERFIVQSPAPQRIFIKVYKDFLNSGLLNGKEQIIFIHLKQYINFANDNGSVQDEVYPTIETLARNVKMSPKTVQTILYQLQKKGMIEIKRRGLNKSNIYKIKDCADMWGCESAEELKESIDEIEEKLMIERLTAKGYHITKEKEPDTLPTKAEHQAPSNSNNVKKNDTMKSEKSQVPERYTLEQLRQFFNYDVMVFEHPGKRDKIDSVIDIIHTAVNTTKPTIRIDREDKPTMAVIGRLMKLNKESILYALQEFSEQTNRINHPSSYMLTTLYHTAEEYRLDIQNQISHDMTYYRDSPDIPQ